MTPKMILVKKKKLFEKKAHDTCRPDNTPNFSLVVVRIKKRRVF
jgi:hypothetical protein